MILRQIRFLVPTILAACAGIASDRLAHAETPTVDQERYQAAEAHALKRWQEAGYDKVPEALNLQNVESGKRQNIAAYLVDILLNANPANTDGTLHYANAGLIPFIKSHKTQYLCVLTEDYYNSTVPTQELAAFNESPMVVIFDFSYLLLSTERQRKADEVALPDSGWGDTMQTAITHFREHGWTDPDNKVHFDCNA